jgi:C4-dicarboxylate transporter DctM subunit
VPLVVYAILTEQNIAKLFAAAMVPGIMAMIGYMIVIAIYVRVVPGLAPESDARAPSVEQRWSASGRWRRSSSCVRRHLRRRVHAHRRRVVGAGHLSGGGGAARAGSKRHQAQLFGTAQTSAMIFMIFLGADMINSALALTQAAQPAGRHGRRAAAGRRWRSSARSWCSTCCWAA